MTYTIDKIYKDLIRKVHPDLHPNMPNATVRTQQVNAVKNNPVALRNLAIQWGYLKPINVNRNHNPFVNTTPNIPFWNKLYPKTLEEMGLHQNSDYRHSSKQIRIKIGNVITTHNIIRTTKKCVVVQYGTIEKRVKMSNIINRIK